MKKFTFIAILFLMYGCASQSPKEIKIPILTKTPAVDMPDRPKLPISELKDNNSTPDVVMKSYVASIKLMQGYSNQLELIIKSLNV